MKKLFTLFTLTFFFCFNAGNLKAQTQVDLNLDYWSMDFGYTSTIPGDTFDNFFWPVNRNFPNDSIFSFRYAAVIFDTLINFNYQTNQLIGTYPLNANTTLRLDSFDLFYSHIRNFTGSTDTLYLSVFDASAATTNITGTGAAAVFNFVPLWRDSIKVTGANTINALGTSIGNNFFYLTRKPNLTLPAGHAYGVYVEFRGNVANHLRILAGGRDHCSSQCAVEPAYAPNNSLYYLNLNLQGTNYSGINPVTYNCPSCAEFEAQNIALPSYAHVTVAGGGGSCTPDPNVTSGLGPVSSNVPCVDQGQPISQTYSFVIPSNIQGIITVNSVTFDNIIGLPTGLNYTFSQSPATYAGGTSGCFTVSGTTSAPCGQYGFPIYVTINSSIGSISGRLDSLATSIGLTGFELRFLRVKAPSGVCPAVNNSQTALFVADPTCGIVNNLSVTISKTDVTCFGGSTGSATANPSGGNTPYTYVWSSSGNTQTINNLTAGTYTVTVTDNNGNTATASTTITQPANPLTVSASATATTCGASSGSATATVTNNTGAPSYLWSPGGGTTATIQNLAAGTYTVTVTAGGCTATASTTVSNSNGPSVTIQKTDPSCFGSNNGSAIATVTGGSTPYIFQWSNNSSGSSINGLSAGTYTLIVTDNAQCAATATITLTQPNPLTLSETITNVNCNGAATGSIALAVGGGTGPYAYSWSNSGTNATISNLTAGTYSVTVTDSRQCTAVSNYTVTQPTALSVTTSSTSSTGNDGTATVTASGGNVPYNYLWSNSATTANITGLAPGTYTVTVTDANGCSETSSVTVANNPVGIGEVENVINVFSLFPNPANEKVSVVLEMNGTYAVRLHVTDVNGRVVFSAKETVNGKLAYEINTREFAAGAYIVEAVADKQSIRQRFMIVR